MTIGCKYKAYDWYESVWGDKLCDDFLNTEECEYDNGDCCQESPVEGWDKYCTACYCKQATMTAKILVVTGEQVAYYEDIKNSSEVLDLINEDISCRNLAPYAMETWGAIGGLVDGQPMICGGRASKIYHEECYTITKTKTTFVTKMTTHRRYAASGVVMNNTKLWVLGGYDGSTWARTTEYVQFGVGSSLGPDLPHPNTYHAFVTVNESYFILIGGWDGSKRLSNTFYYDNEDQTWIPGPDLNKARNSHAAGVGFDNAITNEHYIAVTGGWNGSPMNSVEILYTGYKDWKLGMKYTITYLSLIHI